MRKHDDHTADSERISLAPPKLVPLSPAQRREVVRLLAALIRAARAERSGSFGNLSPESESISQIVVDLAEDLPLDDANNGKPLVSVFRGEPL